MTYKVQIRTGSENLKLIKELQGWMFCNTTQNPLGNGIWMLYPQESTKSREWGKCCALRVRVCAAKEDGGA